TGILLFAWPQRRRFANPTNPLGLCAPLAAAAIPSAMMLGFASGDSLATPASLGDMTRFLVMVAAANAMIVLAALLAFRAVREWRVVGHSEIPSWARWGHRLHARDRKSTRLNSSHVKISYAVFCLKKKK